MGVKGGGGRENVSRDERHNKAEEPSPHEHATNYDDMS